MKTILPNKPTTFTFNYLNVLPKVKGKFIYVALFLLVSATAWAQPNRVEGTWASSTNTYNNSIGTLTQRGAVYFFRGQTSYTGGTARQSSVLFNNSSSSYNPKWTSSGSTLHTLNARLSSASAGATEQAIYNGSTDAQFNVTANMYYTFNIGTSSSGNNDFSILETSFNPATLSSVTQSPTVATGVYDNALVTVTVNYSANNANEYMYVRYSTDAFVTSTVVAVTKGATSGTATIPGFTGGTVVNYYAFSSNQSSISTPADADYLTLNLINATGQNVLGSNFTYTVQNALTKQNGNWNTASTWTGSVVPTSTCNATIAHTVTVASAATANSVTINNVTNSILTVNAGQTLNVTGSLTNNKALTLATTGAIQFGTNATFTNNGTFTGGTGTVTFTSGGTITGSTAVTFYNLSLNLGALTISTTPTVNNNFTLTNGNISANIIYGSSSTLIYAGTSYSNFNEWNNATAGPAGLGRPQNVTINASCTMTLQSNVACAGNITVAGTFKPVGFTFTLGGNLSVTGTFTQGTSTATFAGTSTISAGLTFYNIVVSGGSSLTLPASSTTNIAAGGSISNGGNFDATTNASTLVNFANGGTILGANAITFNNLTLTLGTLTITTTPTVNNNFTLTNGNISANIIYGSSSTLIYAGTSYSNFNEWNNSTFGAAGLGRPQNVTINASCTMTLQSNVACAGNITVAGTFKPVGFTFTLGGNLSVTGTFTQGTSTATFAGTSTISAGLTFYNIVVNGSSSLTLPASSTTTIASGGSISNGGSFDATTNASTVVTFANGGTLLGANGITFNNLTLSFGALTITTTPTVNGTFTLGNGNLTANIIYGASSTLVYNSGTTYSNFKEWNVSTDGAAGLGRPNNVTVNSGTTLNLQSSVAAAGTLSIGGSFTPQSFTFSLRGTMSGAGTFTAGTSTAIFKGSATTLATAFTFNNLTIDPGAGNTLTLGVSGITVNGALNVNTGTLDFGTTTGRTLTVGTSGTLTNAGTIKMQGAAHNLTFNGTAISFTGSLSTGNGSTTTVVFGGTSNLTIPALSGYENLTVNGTGTKTFAGASTVNGNLTIDNTTGSPTVSLGSVASGSPNLLVKGNLAFTRATSGNTCTLDMGSTNAHTLTVSGNVTATGTQVTNGSAAITATGAAHVINLNGATNSVIITLTTSGNGSTVNYPAATAQTMMQVSYENLNISGTGAAVTKTFLGNSSVSGALTADGGAGLLTLAGGKTITLSSGTIINWGNTSDAANTYAFAASALVTLNYTGTTAITTGKEANPTFNGGVFQAITVAAGRTVTQGSAVTLGGVVSSTNYGVLTLGANANWKLAGFNLTVNNPANSWYSIASPSATNKIWINSTGTLIKACSTTSATGLNAVYPIGPDSYYNPLTIANWTVASNGSISIGLTGSKLAAAGTNSLAAYWTLTETTTGTYTADITFAYDALQVTGTQANYVGKVTGDNTNFGGASGATGTSASGANPYTYTGVNAIAGTWVFGESGNFPSGLTYYVRANGNSNTASTFSLISNAGAAAKSVPSAGDNVVMGTFTLTVPSGFSVNYASTNIGTGTLELGSTSGNTLGTVTGTGTIQFTVNSGSPSLPTGTYTSFNTGGSYSFLGSGTYTLPILTSLKNLKVDGGGTKTQGASALTISGTLNIGAASTTAFNSANNITFTTASAGFLTTNNASTTASGNGTFTQTAGGIILSGSGQFIARGNNINLNDITINDPAVFVMDASNFSFSIAGSIYQNSNTTLAFIYGNTALTAVGGTLNAVTASTTLTFTGTGSIGGTGTGGIEFGNLVFGASANYTTSRDIGFHGTLLTCNGTFTQTAGTFYMGDYTGGTNFSLTINSTSGTPNLTFYNLNTSGARTAATFGLSFTVTNNWTDAFGGASGVIGTTIAPDGASFTITLNNYTTTIAGGGITAGTPTSGATIHTLIVQGNYTVNNSFNFCKITNSSLYNMIDLYLMGTGSTMNVGFTNGPPSTTSIGFHDIVHTQYGLDGVTPTAPVNLTIFSNSSPWTSLPFYGNLTHNSANDFKFYSTNGSVHGTLQFNNSILGVPTTIGGTGTGTLYLAHVLISGSGTVVNLGKNLTITGNGNTTSQVGMSALHIYDGGASPFAVMPQFNLNGNTLTFTGGAAGSQASIINNPGTTSSFNAGTGSVVLSPINTAGYSFTGSFTFNNFTANSNGNNHSFVGSSTFNFNGLTDFTTSTFNSGSSTIVNLNGTIRTANTTGLFGGAATSINTASSSPTVNIGSSSSVEYYSSSAQAVTASTAYNLLTISGSSIKTLGGTPLTVASTFTVNTGATFALGGTARTVTLNGDLAASSGTLDITGAAHTLNLLSANNAVGTLTSSTTANAAIVYGSSSAQNVFGSNNYQTLSFTGGGTKTLLGNATANQTLVLGSGNSNINLGNFNLTLGYGTTPATCGALTYTSGNIITNGTGQLIRYFPTSTLPTTAANGNLGHFPIGTSTYNRHAYITFSSATGLSTGGTIGIGHADATGDGPVNYLDGATQIDRRSNASWTVSQSGLVLGTGTIGLGLLATGTIVPNTGQYVNARLVRAADGVGTHVAGTGSDAAPQVNRTFTAVSQLGNTFYAGGPNSVLSNVFVNAIASGNWSSASTWDCNCVPTSVNQVAIASPYAVTLTANAVAKSLNIASGGSLDFGTNKLTLASGGTASILGTVYLANAAGLTGASGAAFDNTNSPTITLGSTSLVNYNADPGSAQTISAASYNDLTISGTRANNVVLANGGTIAVGGTFTASATFTGGATYVNTGNTVNFTSSGAQTIPAISYNNLSNTGNGARTLASSGTIGIAGTYTPSTNASITVTGSTVNFNGTSAQTLPYGTYNNLTISGSSVSFPASAGTINVGGSFSPSALTYTNVGNTTFNFNGASAQTIPAFGYFNLTSSNTGDRSISASGTIKISGLFTKGSNNYTTTGSTIEFNGTGSQTLPIFTYNNLIISQNRTGGLTFSAGIMTINGSLTVSGTTTVANTVTNSKVTFAPSSNVTYDFTGASSPFLFNTITLDSPTQSNISMVGGSVQVITNVYLNNGTITLNNYDFTVGSSTVLCGVVNNNDASYFITAGTGYLYRYYKASGNTQSTGNGRGLTTYRGCCSHDGEGSSFMLGSASGGSRTAWIFPYEATQNIVAGTIGVRYNEGSGLATVSPTYTDNGVTIDRRTKGSWDVKIGTGITGSTTQTWGVQMFNQNQKATSSKYVMLVDNSGAPIANSTAANGDSIGGLTGVQGVRIFTSTANFNNKTYYLGGTSSNMFQVYNSVAGTVNWGDASAWDVGGTTPGTNDDVVITTGTTMKLANGVSYACRTCTVQTGAVLDLMAQQLNTSNTLGSVASVYSLGTIRTALAAGLYNVGGTGAITGTSTALCTFSNTSTVEYYSNSAQLVTPLNYINAGSGTVNTYGNLVSSGTGSRSFEGGTGRYLLINGSFTNGAGNSWTSPTGGTSLVKYNLGSQTITGVQYDSLELSSGVKTLDPSATVKILKSIKSSASSIITTGSTVEYNGTAGQVISGLSYNNLIISGVRTANKSIKLDGGSNISIGGSFSFTATLSGTGTFVTTGSTVDYTGSGSQTIASINYNNLTNSGNGDRILSPTGTIGIAGTFSKGSGNYTITGSTINYNGVDGQTILTGDYNNLTSTNNARVAPAGTINIAGTFTPGTGVWTVDPANTINYNGADGQTVTSWASYQNLTSSNNHSLPANLTVNGTLTLTSGTLDMNGKTLTILGKMGSGSGVLKGSSTSNLVIGGTLASGSFGTLTFGSSSTSDRTLQTLTINRAGLQDSIELGSNLIAQSVAFAAGSNTILNTKSFTLDLGSTGTLNGEKNSSYVVGTLTSNRTVNNLSGTSENFGNVGATILACNNCNMGTVTLTRVAGANAVKKGNTSGGFSANTSINRSYSIVPASQPASLVYFSMNWLSADDRYASTPTTGRVFKSTDNGTTWSKVGGSFNFADRSIVSNTRSFSMWTVADDANPLPLQLTSFTGSVVNKTPVLAWKTAMEVNNDYFEIERSLDGQSFTSVGKVKAKGNSSVETAYTFSDYTTKYLNVTQLYYRLKSHSTNNEDEYYDVISVNIGALDGDIVVYPNPSDGDFNLVFNNSQIQEASYTLSDNAGRVFLTGQIPSPSVGLKYKLETSGLASGIYQLKINSGDKVQTIKLNRK